MSLEDPVMMGQEPKWAPKQASTSMPRSPCSLPFPFRHPLPEMCAAVLRWIQVPTCLEKALRLLSRPASWRHACEAEWVLQIGGSGKKHPWEDVELGPLIGQGSFGKVYRGVWNGAPVAVKVTAALAIHAHHVLCMVLLLIGLVTSSACMAECTA